MQITEEQVEGLRSLRDEKVQAIQLLSKRITELNARVLRINTGRASDRFASEQAMIILQNAVEAKERQEKALVFLNTFFESEV